MDRIYIKVAKNDKGGYIVTTYGTVPSYSVVTENEQDAAQVKELAELVDGAIFGGEMPNSIHIGEVDGGEGVFVRFKDGKTHAAYFKKDTLAREVFGFISNLVVMATKFYSFSEVSK